MRQITYLLVILICWSCTNNHHVDNSSSNNRTDSDLMSTTSQNPTGTETLKCSALDFLNLKDEKLQSDFFKQLDSIRKAQYPNNNEQENEIMVDITPALLKFFLKDIDKAILSKNASFEKEYHFNIAPKGYTDPKKCKDKISVEFYQEHCSYRIVIWNTFLVQDDWCSEHQVIYSFEIKDDQIINFGRNEAG